MRKHRLWQGALAFLLATAACGDDDSPPSSADAGGAVQVTAAQAGKTVSAPVGSTIELTLQTIGPGQYGSPRVSSDAVDYVRVSYATAQNPGGPTQVFSFRCVSQGSATITVPQEGRPDFDGGTEPFTLTLACR